MNVVIPKDYQEGQLLFSHLITLTPEELQNIKTAYLKKECEFYFNPSELHPQNMSSPGAFRIKTPDNTIKFYNGNEFKVEAKERQQGRAVAYIETSKGDKRWTLDGVPHRQNGPAVIYRDGGVRYAFRGRNLNDFVDVLIRKTFPFGSLSKERSEWSFIKSLIEFLWQNGYQFDEYLPGSFQVDKLHESRCEEFLKQLESGQTSEETLLEDLRNSYLEYIVFTKLKNAKIEASNNEDDACMEILKNMKLIESNPSIEQLFHNWQNYDELNEAMLIKSYWSYN